MAATEYKMTINGQLVGSDGNVTYDVLNPATEEVLAKAPHASKEQVDAAVDAADAAFQSWMDTPIEKRKEHMRKCLQVWMGLEEEMTKLLVLEQGKPLEQATWEVVTTRALIQSAIDIKLPVDICEDKPEVRVEVHRRPIGVVVGITPWNFPLLTSVQKWAPAIVLGNTFIWKPSPFTPLTALACTAAMKDCFPPGVFNTVSGDDKSSFNVGAYLTTHPKVSKLTFTGSVKTGMRIMAGAAGDVKRVTLELGGNDAAIVRGDCDPKDIAPKIFSKAFENNGQVCVAVKRCFVQRNIYDEFVKEITEVAKAAKVGDGFQPGVVCGPLNNKMQFDHIKNLVEDSRAHGATIHCGGAPAAEKGFFYQPTIITGVAEGNRIVDEEQFGPVLPVMPYDTDDEAVKRANGTPYGLGGSVWSKDIGAANKIAHRMRAGTVWVNDHMSDTGGPFGGFKWSGLGRELGKEDIVAYTEVQTLSFAK